MVQYLGVCNPYMLVIKELTDCNNDYCSMTISNNWIYKFGKS